MSVFCCAVKPTAAAHRRVPHCDARDRLRAMPEAGPKKALTRTALSAPIARADVQSKFFLGDAEIPAFKPNAGDGDQRHQPAQENQKKETKNTHNRTENTTDQNKPAGKT